MILDFAWLYANDSQAMLLCCSDHLRIFAIQHGMKSGGVLRVDTRLFGKWAKTIRSSEYIKNGDFDRHMSRWRTAGVRKRAAPSTVIAEANCLPYLYGWVGVWLGAVAMTWATARSRTPAWGWLYVIMTWATARSRTSAWGWLYVFLHELQCETKRPD